MKNLIIWLNSIINKHKALKRWKRVVTVLAAIMTFVTTYALILPAITVERNRVEDVGGMYLEHETDTNDMLEENALEPIGVSIAADHENAVTFAYADGSMTATAVFGTDEEIPEGAELVVNPVDPESEEYISLSSRSAELLDKEFIYDVTTCSFYDFALVCDNIDVTPKTGLVDIQIIFHDNTVEHLEDTLFAGRFARQTDDASGFAAKAADDTDAVGAADTLAAVDTDATADTLAADNFQEVSENLSDVTDELVSVNPDESSVIELTDGVITVLSLKGNDLSENESLVGILAGNVDEEIKAAAAEIDAEIPDYDDAQEENAQADSAGTDGDEAAPNVGTLKATGSDYTVTLTYDATSEIPEGAILTVSEIAQDSKEYKNYLEKTKKAMGLTEEETLPRFAARFFDIKIMVDGKEFSPESGVSVEITYAEPLAENPDTEVSAVHFANKKADAEVIDANTSEVQDDGTATAQFTAESFSVYGIVYTVDFHYEVNGKEYEFSLPGGGFVSFTDLVEVLGIVGDTNSDNNGDENGPEIADNAGENAASEGAEENGVNSNANMLLTLGDVEVSEATRKFVADVVSVEFSDPELVWIKKVNTDTTVGELKQANKIVCQYSAELTKEQINEINAQSMRAGDWALISMFPFTSEETLTITMKDGKQYVVKVTDAQISTNVLTADGITFCITVNYDDSAEIPVGTRLVAEEIDQKSVEFIQRVSETLAEVNKGYFEEQELLKKGVDPDTIEHVQPVSMDQARFFHVSLMHEGRKIEPKTPVKVDIKYVDGLGVEGIAERIPGVSHITDDTVEVISEVKTETDKEGRIIEFEYTQDGFSDIGTFIGHEGHNGLMKASAPGVNLRGSGTDETSTIEDFIAENGAPEASKVLNDNGDGTYTLALHVKPQSSEYTKIKKTNVLFIMDRSSSMTYDSEASYVEFANEADAIAAVSSGVNVYGYVGTVYTALSYVVTDFGGRWTSASGVYDTSNGLYYGVSGSRFSQEQAALGNLINQLMLKNEGSANDTENVEISIMSFSTYAGNDQLWTYVGGTRTSNWGTDSDHPTHPWGNTEVGWTSGTDATALINGVYDLSMARGTNWEEALRQAKLIMDAKKQAEEAAGHDDEDYFVVFLTDGAPTATSWSITQRDPTYEWGAYYGNNTTHPDGTPPYLNDEGIPYAYDPARDDARAIVAAGYSLFNIFTYGAGNDYRYMERLTNYAYTGGNDAVSDPLLEAYSQYFKNATNTAELVDYLNHIFKEITGNIGHSQVKIKDGLSQGAMTSTFVNGKPSAVHYTVTPGQGSSMLPYTVQATMPEEGTEPIVTFTINGQNYTTTSGAVQKKVNPADAYDAGEYYYVKVGNVEYKMALASVEGPGEHEGELTWDLTPMGILWDDCDYKAEFVVWPKQEAYNYVAGLNNEMPGFDWDQETANEHEHIDSQGRKYWSHGVDGLESIVKYEDGTFAVLTNTHQEVEYSVAKVEGEELKEKTDPTDKSLDFPDPMPLNATKTNLEKQWNVDRNPALLAQYLYNPDGSPTKFVAEFDISSDNDTNPFATVSLGWDKDLEQYVWEDSSVRRVVYNGHVYHIGTRWSDEINIATGLMVTGDRLQALGLNPKDYPKAQYGETIYYILERGHDYHVKERTEDEGTGGEGTGGEGTGGEGTGGEGTEGEGTAKKGLGYEFDFESPIFHPMLVNGQMMNIIFENEMNEETLSLIDPYPIDKMIPAPMNSIGSLVVENTLRGYINVEKVVVDKDGKTKLPDDTTQFSYDVVLENTVLDPAPFTVDDNNVPWYGINGLFYHEIIGGEYRYYEAAPLGGNRLSLLTESGETVIAETEGDPFNKDIIGPTKIRIVLNEEEGEYGDWFDLYGNEMVHDSDSHVHDTIQIRQGQTLNIANVPKGTIYTITESILDPDYDLMSIVWGIRDGNKTITSGRVEDISSGSITGTVVTNRDNHITFTNKIHSADLKVKKVDENGKGLLGAKFTLTKTIVDPETEAQTWTLPEPGTADTGIYTFADLPDGVYTLTETPPPNYTGVAPITFAVANGVIYMPGDTLPAGVTLPDDASLPADVIWENNNNKTFSLKIPNVHIQPPENEIRVEKRWVDQNGNTSEGSRDVKVQLRRKKLDSHDVTVVFEAGQYGGNTPHFEEVFPSVSGDTVTIEYSLLPNGQWNNTTINISKSPENVTLTGPTSLGNNKYRIVVSGVTSDVTVTLFFTNKSWQLWNYYNNNIKSTVTVTGNGQGGNDFVPDDDFPASADLAKATKTLTAPDYFASWSFGEGSAYDFPAAGYQYYIVELDENDQPLEVGQGGLVSIDNNGGISTGIITATDKINGSLTLKKQLNALVNEDVSHAAGKYNFTVTGPGEPGTTKYVQIRINAAGEVTYKISKTEISFDDTVGFVNAPSDGTVLIPDLIAGSYKVTEGAYQLDDQSGKYTTSLGQIEVESGTADITNASATLNVRAENTPSAAATFTNMLVPMVDVPVLKNWQWSANDNGKVASWTAKFNLEYREVLVSGEEASDAKHSWAPVYETNGTTQKSVTLRSTDSVQEKFTNLPLYKTHDNGSVYRLIYAVDEVDYTITFNDGRNPATETWSKSESGHLTDHYSPDYEQDAGESETPDDPEDWDEWYTISLKNVRSTKEIEKTIDLSLEKVWEDETLRNDPESKATFQLMRTYHEEYLDYNKNDLDPDDLVTVKLDLGDGTTKQLIVPRGAPVYVTAVVMPGKTASLRFSKEGSGEFLLTGPDAVSTSQQFIRTSTPFPANADGDEMTVSFTRGDTSVLVGGLDGLGLASLDPDDTTEEREDGAFNNPMSQDGQSAGQKFTLDAEHGWRKEWAGLPQVVEELSVSDNGTRMKTIVYSYYLKEIEEECYPKNYNVSFRNGLGNENNPLISSGSVVAVNKLETTELSGTKTWGLDGNSSYVLGTPILKLSRRTETKDEDGNGNPITTLSEPEVVTVSGDGTEQFLQPTWHSDGAFTRSFTYTGLPKQDKDGKTYVYSVEEVEFTVGAGENAVVYTAVRQPDGTYIVTPDKEGAEIFVVTQTGNDIVNEPQKVADLKLKKQITINDFNPANSAVEDKTQADGTYIFEIRGKAETLTAGKSYTVRITIEDGIAVSATLCDNTAETPQDTEVTLTADNAVLIPDMIPGIYTITEKADSNTVLTALNSTQTSTVADLDQRSIEITLSGDDSEVQMVTATNNHGDNTETDIAHISVRKTFKGLKPGQKLPDNFHVSVTVSGHIDGEDKELEYTLRGETNTAEGIIWNETVNDDGDVIWNWRIAIKGLNPDATVNIQEYGYELAGYDVDKEVNGTHGTAYSGTVSPRTTIQGINEVITEQNSLEFPLNDLGTSATIFIARIEPSQTSLVISKNRLNLSERAALEQMLRQMPNAQDWYNGTTPRYYSFEDAANNKINIRSERHPNKVSLVTYSDEDGGKITFSEKCDWNMVACRTIIFKPGRPADFNYVNSYTELGIDIDLHKVDKNNREVKLSGARFTVTKLNENSTKSHIQYKVLEGTDTPEFQKSSAMTDAEGMTSISGLTSGYYEIRETKTPDGYILTGDERFYAKVEDGVAVYLNVSEDEETTIEHWSPITETASDALIQVTNGRADDPDTPDEDETINTSFSIGNTPGVALPHTGGPGTNLFYFIGCILMVFAGVGIIMRRRRESA